MSENIQPEADPARETVKPRGIHKFWGKLTKNAIPENERRDRSYTGLSALLRSPGENNITYGSALPIGGGYVYNPGRW